MPAVRGYEVVRDIEAVAREVKRRNQSYQWHTIPPKGWEPVAEWLGGAIHQLVQLTGASFP